MNGNRPMTVYFVKPVGLAGPIKIGCTTMLDKRLVMLGAWVPFPLEVLATVPGSFKLENNIQDCFTHAHIRGEWFNPVPELVEAIRKIASGMPVEQAIDLSKRQPGRKRRTWGPEHTRRRSVRSRVIMAERRAFRATGTHCHEPTDVRAIFHRWSGDVNAGPSAAEMASIEAYIANPLNHPNTVQ